LLGERGFFAPDSHWEGYVMGIKRLQQIWSAACLAAALAAVPAQAATGTMDIGEQSGLDLASDQSDTGWTWTASSDTLTLDNNYTAEPIAVICVSSDSINLVYTGNVNISSDITDAVSCNGNLTITESGNSGTLSLGYTGSGHYSGLFVMKNLTVSSGTVSASSAGTNSATAPAAVIYVCGNITIGGSASVTANVTGADANGIVSESNDIFIPSPANPPKLKKSASKSSPKSAKSR
jgi:hypothetical protein